MEYHSEYERIQFIEKLYSDLVRYQGGKLYMCDTRISIFPLDFNISRDANTAKYTLRANSKDTDITIHTLIRFQKDHPYDLNHLRDYVHDGEIRLDSERRLPDESCMGLYKYNLRIVSTFNWFHYDREAIERNHTIKNIINEE